MLAPRIHYYRYRVATIRSVSVRARVECGLVIRKSFSKVASDAIEMVETSGCGVRFVLGSVVNSTIPSGGD